MQGYYKCDCGQEFDNPQKFNGHKSHCVTHLTLANKLDQRNEIQEKFRKGGLDAAKSKKSKASQTKETSLNEWIKERHVCEKCGKILTEKFGTGRFCSRSCANSHCISETTKAKISETLCKKHGTCKKERTSKQRQQIIKGQNFAKEINLENSPYSQYNTAFKRNCQVDKREAYKLCLYEGNKLIKSTIVLTHRYNMACAIGRLLLPNEVVHHIDGNKSNNAIENLQLMSRKEHSRLHAQNNNTLVTYTKIHGAWNKGLKHCFSKESVDKTTKTHKDNMER